MEYPLPVEYKGIKLDCGYCMDIPADNRLIIKLKAVEEIKGIHKVQLLTYVKLSGFDTGLLINFNVERLKDGIEPPRNKLRGISDCQGKHLLVFARPVKCRFAPLLRRI